MECFVLKHSSEVCCVGGQVSFYLFAEARVACKFQIRVILSWAIHHLRPKQNHTQFGKKTTEGGMGIGFLKNATWVTLNWMTSRSMAARRPSGPSLAPSEGYVQAEEERAMFPFKWPGQISVSLFWGTHDTSPPIKMKYRGSSRHGAVVNESN